MLRTTAAQENYIDLDVADPPDETGSDDEFPGYVGELPDSQPVFDSEPTGMALPVDTLHYEERDGRPVSSREEQLQARIESLKHVIEIEDHGGEENPPPHEEPLSPVSKRVSDLEARIFALKKLKDTTPVPPESKTFPILCLAHCVSSRRCLKIYCFGSIVQPYMFVSDCPGKSGLCHFHRQLNGQLWTTRRRRRCHPQQLGKDGKVKGMKLYYLRSMGSPPSWAVSLFL